MYLVDQNAAHERVLYTQLIEELSAGSLKRETLEESQTIALDPDDATHLEEVGPLLEKVGFEIEVFGPNTYVFRSLPDCIAGRTAADVLLPILDHLRRAEKTELAALAALAAAAAVRRGQVLQSDEMQALIAKLEYCPNPLESPSGRKTFIHLSSDQLAEEFQRA